jgi:hypothetical protein
MVESENIYSAIKIVISIICGFGLGVLVGWVISQSKERMKILGYYRKNRMKFLEEAVNDLYLTYRAKK